MSLYPRKFLNYWCVLGTPSMSLKIQDKASVQSKSGIYRGCLYHTRVFFPFSTPEFFLPSDEDLTVVDIPCIVHLQPPTSSFLSTGAPAAALLP